MVVLTHEGVRLYQQTDPMALFTYEGIRLLYGYHKFMVHLEEADVANNHNNNEEGKQLCYLQTDDTGCACTIYASRYEEKLYYCDTIV